MPVTNAVEVAAVLLRMAFSAVFVHPHMSATAARNTEKGNPIVCTVVLAR